MYHYRKTHQLYARRTQKDQKISCPFPLCNEEDESQPIIKNGQTMYIIPNRTTYDLFEARRVLDHLMIIPKRHVISIAEFTDEERLEMITLAGEYEKQGYNIYARAVGSDSRSVTHQHTHLIKTDNKTANVLLYTQKPYFVAKL